MANIRQSYFLARFWIRYIVDVISACWAPQDIRHLPRQIRPENPTHRPPLAAETSPSPLRPPPQSPSTTIASTPPPLHYRRPLLPSQSPSSTTAIITNTTTTHITYQPPLPLLPQPLPPLPPPLLAPSPDSNSHHHHLQFGPITTRNSANINPLTNTTNVSAKATHHPRLERFMILSFWESKYIQRKYEYCIPVECISALCGMVAIIIEDSIWVDHIWDSRGHNLNSSRLYCRGTLARPIAGSTCWLILKHCGMF